MIYLVLKKSFNTKTKTEYFCVKQKRIHEYIAQY